MKGTVEMALPSLLLYAHPVVIPWSTWERLTGHFTAPGVILVSVFTFSLSWNKLFLFSTTMTISKMKLFPLAVVIFHQVFHECFTHQSKWSFLLKVFIECVYSNFACFRRLNGQPLGSYLGGKMNFWDNFPAWSQWVHRSVDADDE